MDGNVRCWSPGSGTILNPEPEFTFAGPEEEGGGGGGGRPNTYTRTRVSAARCCRRGSLRRIPHARSLSSRACPPLESTPPHKPHLVRRRLSPLHLGRAPRGCRHSRTVPSQPERPSFPPDSPLPQDAILTMCTTTDAASNSVLMVSYVNDRAVRLFELPSFEPRGCLPNVRRRAWAGGEGPVRACACAQQRQRWCPGWWHAGGGWGRTTMPRKRAPTPPEEARTACVGVGPAR
jgi:hypothetical protein